MEHQSTSPPPGRTSTSPTTNVKAHHDAINVVENSCEEATPSDYIHTDTKIPLKNTAASMLMEASQREEEGNGPRGPKQNLSHTFKGQQRSMENIAELATTVSSDFNS